MLIQDLLPGHQYFIAVPTEAAAREVLAGMKTYLDVSKIQAVVVVADQVQVVEFKPNQN